MQLICLRSITRFVLFLPYTIFTQYGGRLLAPLCLLVKTEGGCPRLIRLLSITKSVGRGLTIELINTYLTKCVIAYCALCLVCSQPRPCALAATCVWLKSTKSPLVLGVMFLPAATHYLVYPGAVQCCCVGGLLNVDGSQRDMFARFFLILLTITG